MSIITQIADAEEGSRLFISIAQITRLLYEARINKREWSYEIERLKGPDGAILGKCFSDGCTITIKIEPAAPPSGVEQTVAT